MVQQVQNVIDINVNSHSNMEHNREMDPLVDANEETMCNNNHIKDIPMNNEVDISISSRNNLLDQGYERVVTIEMEVIFISTEVETILMLIRGHHIMLLIRHQVFNY